MISKQREIKGNTQQQQQLSLIPLCGVGYMDQTTSYTKTKYI